MPGGVHAFFTVVGPPGDFIVDSGLDTRNSHVYTRIHIESGTVNRRST